MKLEETRSKRGNIIAFAWGSRLATFVKKMESIKNPEILGFGKLVVKEGNIKLSGIWDEKNIMENEIDHYLDVVDWVQGLEFFK